MVAALGRAPSWTPAGGKPPGRGGGRGPGRGAGGPSQEGSYFPEGGVRPFTTLKRLCSSLSPQ